MITVTSGKREGLPNEREIIPKSTVRSVVVVRIYITDCGLDPSIGEVALTEL